VVRWVTVAAAAFIFIVSRAPFLYWLTTDYVFTNRRIIVRGVHRAQRT
jgi:hypothetical protein